MSATEELRRLLDERAVEWWEDAFDCKHRTIFDGENNVRYCVHQLGCVLFISSALSVTPEQAVKATLGSDDLYDAGFASGVQAVFQQLEGIEDYEELQDLIAEYWEEGEGNDAE